MSKTKNNKTLSKIADSPSLLPIAFNKICSKYMIYP